MHKVKETEEKCADSRGNHPEDVDVLQSKGVHVLAEDRAADENGEVDDPEDEAIFRDGGSLGLCLDRVEGCLDGVRQAPGDVNCTEED